MNKYIGIFLIALCRVHSEGCHVNCPEDGEMACGFNPRANEYTLFTSKCAMRAYVNCYNVVLAETKLIYCIRGQNVTRRSISEESCPTFCPNHYRPVCGAMKLKFYKYRTFTNGCYLDMLNCRGEDEMSAYVEVPLEFCQRHSMKNIFKEKIFMSNTRDYHEY